MTVVSMGPRNAPAHRRLSRQTRSARRQSSEQARRNRASLRSSLVLRRWHSRQSQPRFSIVNALLMCLRSQRPGHVNRQPVVQLGSRTAAALAHRDLNARLLAAGHQVGVQAVPVPRQLYAGGVGVAPAADAADRGITPVRRSPDESPGMRRGVTPVVKDQPPEASPAHRVVHLIHADPRIVIVTQCDKPHPITSAWHLVVQPAGKRPHVLIDLLPDDLPDVVRHPHILGVRG